MCNDKMYKALYNFKKTHPTSLTFAENDLFIELPGASGDKNWYYVLTLGGISGFVPRNYVSKHTIDDQEFLNVLLKAREKVKLSSMGEREKGDLLAKLDLAKKSVSPQQQQQQPPPPPLEPRVIDAQTLPRVIETQTLSQVIETQAVAQAVDKQTQQIQVQETNSRSVSPHSSTPPKSMKKRAAPMPPTSAASNSPRSSESPDRISLADSQNQSCARPQNEISRQRSVTTVRRPSVTDPTSDQISQSSRELVEMVRDHTGLSHSTSQSTVVMILHFLTENFQRLDRNLPALLEEFERPTTSGKNEIVVSSDAKAMESILEELTKRKEDDQQRNWMLHKDEHIIRDLIHNLQNILQNAQKEICLYVLKKFKYFYVHSLVEYFQMEARWSIRQKLMETFVMMCSLDPIIVSIMLNSVLTTELAQDLFQHTDNVDRLRHCGLLLTVILCRGEPLPVHSLAHLGETFVNFLLEHIENPLSREHERDVADVFIGLLFSYNLQFKDKSSNVTVKCLSRRSSAKVFTEQLLLLLNREDDPTAIIYHPEEDYYDDPTQMPTNATHKMVLDIFQDKHCHELFYTNDLYVLIDIIVRQLSDLSQEDVKRKWYATMCQLVLLRSNYSDHLHRYKDLERCFMRILDEEDGSKEKEIVIKICKEIPAFTSLGDTESNF